MEKKNRIALVVQRYGIDIIGGAETHARLVAEYLYQSNRYEIEVLTTTSVQTSWEGHYEPGVDTINGVCVRRFRVDGTRWRFFSIVHQILKLKNSRLLRRFFSGKYSRKFEAIWYRAQGPYCPSLIAYLEENTENYDAVIFFTYLYYPTVEGISRVSAKSILVPTLHDEAALHNLRTSELFSNARVIFANTHWEKNLISAINPELTKKTEIVGLGIDPPIFLQEENTSRNRYGLYLGRIGSAKGVDRLLEVFSDCHKKGLIDCELWLGGSLDPGFVMKELQGVKYLGVLSESSKWQIIRNAKFIINSSYHESFSLLTFEALACEKPVILNGDCALFVEYASKIPGVYLYKSSEELVFGIEAAQVIPREVMKNAKEIVLKSYRWSNVVEKYHRAIDSI